MLEAIESVLQRGEVLLGRTHRGEMEQRRASKKREAEAADPPQAIQRRAQ